MPTFYSEEDDNLVASENEAAADQLTSFSDAAGASTAGSKAGSKAPTADVIRVEQDKDASEDDGDDGDVTEYVVDCIVNHAWMGKVLKYEVKWVDYPDKKDHTWEPEENLETAYESLEAYWKKIGGRPEPPSRKRKSVAAKETPEPKRRGRKPRQSLPSHAKNKSNADIKSETRDSDVETHEEWTPPNGSWEDHVLNVDVIEDNRDPTTAERSLYAYVIWHHGKKTRHPINTLRYKCPQKLLSYYEQHLVFKSTASDDGVEGVNPESIEA